MSVNKVTHMRSSCLITKPLPGQEGKMWHVVLCFILKRHKVNCPYLTVVQWFGYVSMRGFPFNVTLRFHNTRRAARSMCLYVIILCSFVFIYYNFFLPFQRSWASYYTVKDFCNSEMCDEDKTITWVILIFLFLWIQHVQRGRQSDFKQGTNLNWLPGESILQVIGGREGIRILLYRFGKA